MALNLSALQPRKRQGTLDTTALSTPRQKSGGDIVDIFLNTVRGIPSAVNKLFFEQETAPQRFLKEITGFRSPAERQRDLLAQSRATRLPKKRLDRFGLPIATLGKPTRGEREILKTATPQEQVLLAREGAIMAAGFAGFAPQRKLLTGVAKQVAKSSDIQVIAKLIKKEVPEMTDDVATKFATIFKDLKNVRQVDTAINKIKFQYVKPKAPTRAPTGVVTKALETKLPTVTSKGVAIKPSPLIQEARKYKSAEEFVKDFNRNVSTRSQSRSDGVDIGMDNFVNSLDNRPAIRTFDKGGGYDRGNTDILKYVPAKDAKNIKAYFSDGKVPEEIIVYRGGGKRVSGELRDGEYLTTNKGVAQAYGTKFKEFKVKTKDLLFDPKEAVTDSSGNNQGVVVYNPDHSLAKVNNYLKENNTTLTDIYNKAQEVKPLEEIFTPKVRQIKTSAEIPSLEKTVEGIKLPERQPVARLPDTTPEVQKVSYVNDTINETKVNNEIYKVVENRDVTNTVKDVSTTPPEPASDLLTTRKIKQTEGWKDFAKYAEENLQEKDISPAIVFRHATMTMERVAEFLDGGIGGRTYREIVKPVYDSARKMADEGSIIKNEVGSFRVLEGSSIDRDASLFAQKKITDAPEKSKEIAKYIRGKYDELIERLNETRVKIGIEPFQKRQDYITHINEINVLSELFGGMERISVKRHISNLKSELLDAHPDWTDARAFDAAKRQVEGLTGVAQYVDARQPIFKFAKQRLGEYESDPSITRSFNAYLSNALRYIYQAENVAKNKALKDVLPANAKEFTRLWNTEQVAGRQPPSFLSPVAKRALSALRGTLGANTIAGNLSTTMMQLTSFPQVFALAGPVNTFYGIGSQLRSYIPGLTNMYKSSRTKALRDLDIDIGLGDSLIDQLLIKIGKHNKIRNTSARTRLAVDLGRDFTAGIMKTADQFTVGASYQAFYRKGLMDGLEPAEAMEFADIMAGKTQANYFKEALPPFLNTIEGKTLGQFGTYGMNQWELFKRDFGKDFKFDEKNPKSVKNFFKQFMVFLTSAYLVDSISEDTFGRQPYDVKSLVDDSVGFAKGELTSGQLLDTSKETISSYIPFMSSVKFNSLPPVAEFVKDVINAVVGTGDKQEKSTKNLSEKWSYNILLPYGGNQLRKSLQGIEASAKVDLPFVRNTSKNLDIQNNLDQAKSILFGPYATEESISYFENQKRREGIKEQYEITGTITSDENIAKLDKMSDEEFDIYTDQYATSTKKTINNKMGKSSRPSLESIFSR